MKTFSFKHIVSRIYRWLSHPENKDSLPPSIRSADSWRSKGVQIGENTHFYGNVVLGRSGKDPIVIGDNCVLVNCTILGHDASTNRALGIGKSPAIPVVIEDNCFVGYGAIVLMGVTVGRGSIVGAGAVVTSDIPPGVVVAGNPARMICTVDELVERRKRLTREHPEYFTDLPPDLVSKDIPLSEPEA